MKTESRSDILAISHDFKPNTGGEAEFSYQLARALKENGEAIHVIAPPAPGLVPDDSALNGCLTRTLKVDRFQSAKSFVGAIKWPFAMMSLIRSIRRVAREYRASVCLVTSHMTWIMLALDALRLDFAMVLHGEEAIWMLQRGPISRRLFLRALERSKFIFFNSEFSRQGVISVAPFVGSKSEAVGCGVRIGEDATDPIDRDTARQSLGWGGEPVLLTVAKLVDRKGIDTVIRAMPAILLEYPNCRYVIVGAGPEKENLLELARDLSVSENISFEGRVSNEKKIRIYSASDIFVMASQSDEYGAEEGFGIVFLEANLYGLPVIGSRCGGVVEAVKHRVNGLLVEQRSSSQVGDAVLSLLSDPKKREQMAHAGRKRILERYNWSSIANSVAARLRLINQTEV